MVIVVPRLERLSVCLFALKLLFPHNELPAYYYKFIMILDGFMYLDIIKGLYTRVEFVAVIINR